MTGWLAVAAVFVTLLGLWVVGSAALDALTAAWRRHVDLSEMRRARRRSR